MAQFEPGQSGNPNGRPKGSGNKAGREIKAAIESLLNDDTIKAKIKKELEKLEGKDFIKAITDLMPYVVPKQQAVSNMIKWEDLSDEEMDEVIQRLKKGSDE